MVQLSAVAQARSSDEESVSSAVRDVKSVGWNYASPIVYQRDADAVASRIHRSCVDRQVRDASADEQFGDELPPQSEQQ